MMLCKNIILVRLNFIIINKMINKKFHIFEEKFLEIQNKLDI